MRRGPMDQVGAYKLDRNRDKFEENLEPNDIMGKLIALDVLSEDDVDTIKHTQPPTRQTRVSAFMKIIKARGSNAYPKFLEALKAAEYQYLIDMLENTPVQGIQEEVHVMRPQGAVSGPTKEEIPQRIKQKRVDSKFLSKISGAVGMGWEHIALGLNMTQVQIDHAKLDNPHSASLQFYSCLSKWFNSQPNATYGHLYCVLSEKRDMVPMEWDVIMKALAAAADS